MHMASIALDTVARSLNGQKQSHRLQQQGATGIILFSSAGHLLFLSAEAKAFTSQWYPLSTGENGGSLIPDQIHSLVHELISRLVQCGYPKDCESIQVERLCFANDQRFLLRGFCIPDEALIQNSRLLVIMEKLHQQELQCPNADMRHRYRLTEREQMVIIYLMLGFTNKEIANRIHLSEYTVKEHLKRIMHKTQTTTRTGLLARMVFPTPEAAEAAVQSVLSQPIETEQDLPRLVR
jgi:DNA-binding CsgD family transcriptional regulator